MPFGKYRGRHLIHLPDAYLVWFAGKGFPRGHLGELLRSVHEMKANGLGPFLDSLLDRERDAGEPAKPTVTAGAARSRDPGAAE